MAPLAETCDASWQILKGLCLTVINVIFFTSNLVIKQQTVLLFLFSSSQREAVVFPPVLRSPISGLPQNNVQVIGVMLVEYAVGREMSSPQHRAAREGRTGCDVRFKSRNPTTCFGGNCDPLGRLWGAHCNKPADFCWGELTFFTKG